jgi:hypothetical protein
MVFSSDAYLMPPVGLSDWQTHNYAAARWSRYGAYLDFYRGYQWNESRRPGERRLTINYARAFIQKGAAYLMGKPVQFELIPNGDSAEAQTEAARCEAILRQIWDANSLALVDYDAAVDCAVLGDGAFKVTLQPADPNDKFRVPSAEFRVGDGNFNSKLGTQHSELRVCVRAVDVNGLEAGFQADDTRSLRWVTEQYTLTGAALREQYGPERLAAVGLDVPEEQTAVVTEHWTAQEYSVKVKNTVLLEEANPYGFIPYVIFPNRSVPRSPWGESDLEDIMSLASELNVRTSVLSQLLQVSGNPPLVLENVEDAQGLRVGPGAVWSLPEGSKAYLLELLTSGGVDLHVQYLELLYKMLHDLTELPSSGFGRDHEGRLGQSSGVALELLLQPVVQRVNRKRRIWDEVLDRRNRMMLALAGLPVHRSRIQWPDITPKDRAGLVTQEVGLVASSIHSLETARRILGDEQPEKENDLILAERQKLGLSNGSATSHKGAGAGGSFDQPPVRLSGALVQGLSNSAG